MEMVFDNPVFNKGLNSTCRKGLKWADSQGWAVNTNGHGFILILGIKTCSFDELTDENLIYNHEPSCRTVDGLYEAMVRSYPDFNRTDMITLATFRFL